MSNSLHIQVPQPEITTRRGRRAVRQRRFVAAREAALAARLAKLDYKVSGETGAMKVPTKARTWYLGGRLNAHRPPPGRAWDRSGATYVVGVDGVRFDEPINHHRWRRLMANKATPTTTE